VFWLSSSPYAVVTATNVFPQQENITLDLRFALPFINLLVGRPCEKFYEFWYFKCLEKLLVQTAQCDVVLSIAYDDVAT
jgi:hypothetical protein